MIAGRNACEGRENGQFGYRGWLALAVTLLIIRSASVVPRGIGLHGRGMVFAQFSRVVPS